MNATSSIVIVAIVIGGGDDDSSYRGDRDRGTSCDDDGDDAANCDGDGDQVICAGSPRVSAMGHSRRFHNVRVTSAFPPIAAV